MAIDDQNANSPTTPGGSSDNGAPLNAPPRIGAPVELGAAPLVRPAVIPGNSDDTANVSSDDNAKPDSAIDTADFATTAMPMSPVPITPARPIPVSKPADTDGTDDAVLGTLAEPLTPAAPFVGTLSTDNTFVKADATDEVADSETAGDTAANEFEAARAMTGLDRSRDKAAEKSTARKAKDAKTAAKAAAKEEARTKARDKAAAKEETRDKTSKASEADRAIETDKADDAKKTDAKTSANAGSVSKTDKDAKGDRGAKDGKSKRKSRFTRRQIIIALIVVIVVVDAALVVWLFGLFGGGNPFASAPPNSDTAQVIQRQQHNNDRIAELGYDTALTFSNYPSLTIVNTSSLKTISNNIYKTGPDDSQLLYDEMIVGRAIKFNSDWIKYLNENNQDVMASVKPDSPAVTKLYEWGKSSDSMATFHRLSIGEIRYTGKYYFILVQATYTLLGNGQTELFEDIFAYKLETSGDTILITDFERIPYNPPSLPTETPPAENPDETTPGDEAVNPDETTDEATEGSGEPTDEATEDSDSTDETQEPGESPSG